MYLVVTSSKGISSVVMSRLLGITQATAWRIGHAIRTMMNDRDGAPLSGINVIRAFGMGHRTVVGRAKELVRGEVHSNTADEIGSMLERARMGVWHRMSRLHLQRHLDEIGFRWNCRLKREFVSKSGRRRRIITTIPLPDMLSRLLYPATGRQVRRTRTMV